MRETEAYWKALWSIALTLAVEKHLELCPILDRTGAGFRSVVDHRPALDVAMRIIASVACLSGQHAV